LNGFASLILAECIAPMAPKSHIDSENRAFTALAWLNVPNPKVSKVIACIQCCRALFLLPLAAVALIIFGILSFWSLPSGTGHIPLLTGLSLISGLAVLITALWVIWRQYVGPIMELHNWVLSMRGGNLSARMPIPKRGEFSDLFSHLNSLGDMLQSLARDTELQLQRHTGHIAQKTHSLSVLYDVAASINVSRDLNDLLTRVLHTLTEVVGARAASVRLLTDDGDMKLVASIGLDQDLIDRERLLPADSCLCGKVTQDDEVLVQDTLLPCSMRVGRPFFEGNHLSMLVVPLQYRGQTLGVYNLFVDEKTVSQHEDLKNLFTSIGRHLGMAIDKARLDEEANRLSIMEERTRIANELHDSLAQTLASVRFQVRVLDETLHQGDEATIWHELERIENSLDEAHTELRELIAHFRAPMHKHGLIPSIEQTVERFRRDCRDIHVFLQKEWPDIALPSEYEIQVLRIVQEALANVRKHSQADTVRVLLKGDEGNNYRVLVEDDGIGLGETSPIEKPGEHVGLSVMKDRARRIGGKLRIESEPGEGVQILLSFRYPNDNTVSLEPKQVIGNV
jgi:two-component system nitrate/nitrite sensor histidine kinase NarX